MLQGQMGKTYDGFINTRRDLIESYMTLGQFMTYLMIYCNFFPFIVLPPGGQWMIREMRYSQLEEYNKLADITLSLDNDATDYDVAETYSLIDNEVMKHGTHAYAYGTEEIINRYSHLEEKHNTVWYRSSETVLSEYPYTNWLSKKKWPLNEELNLHMLNYQEV